MVEKPICTSCGSETDMTFHGQCRACLIDDFDDGDTDLCWQCHGDGVVYDCFEEWACVDPEGGCDLCERRCDVCRATPSPPTPWAGKQEMIE